MKQIRRLLAYLHAGSMDLSVGALLITTQTALLGITLEWWHLFLGASLTALPDIDLVAPIIREVFGREKIHGNHHESFTHWPIFMLPIVSLTALVAGGLSWAVVVCVGVLAHYLHDAYMMGWPAGLNWLVRIKRKPINDPSFVEPETWLERNWLHWSLLSAVETSIAVLALLLALAIIVLR
jgi:hypothetical protein